MSWKHWTAVTVVIGLGIVSQIPGSDDMAMSAPSGIDSPGAASEADVAGAYRTVALEVTGMT
jgi:hypothetical protein